MKRVVFVALMIAMGLILTAKAQEQWEPVVEGFYEGQRVNLFHQSVCRGKAAAADMDGDGDIDLLIGGDYFVRYFRNDGTPVRPAWTLVNGNVLNMPKTHAYHMLQPAVADFDSDGDLDVVIACWQGEVYYYRNDGNMVFTEVTNALVPSQGAHASVGAKDLNNDGYCDLLLGTDAGVFFFRNTGGTGVPQPNFESPVELIPDNNSRQITLFDIDGDHDFDLFAGTALGHDTPTGRIEFYRNDGSLSAPLFVLENSDYFPGIPDIYWPLPSVFDADADGDSDCLIFVHTSGGFYSFMENIGSAYSPQWSVTHKYFQTFTYKHLNGIAAFGDIDDDGDLDAIQMGARTSFGLYRNDGSPTCPNWVLADEALIAHNSWFYGSVLQDIDDDGDLDLFAVNVEGYDPGGPRVWFWRNTGSPSVPVFVLESTGWQGIQRESVPIGGWFTSLCFGDVNGDSLPDLVMGTCHTGKAYLYFNTGSLSNPSFNPNAAIELVTTSGPNDYTFPELVDVDRDGDLDLLVGVSDATNGQVNFFRNTGTRFSHNYVLETGNWMNLGTYYIPPVSAADIDGDGAPNVFVSSYDGGMVQYRCVLPSLDISPNMATVEDSDSVNLVVSGAVGSVTWSRLHDRSGALLIPGGTACTYVSGATAGVVDVIEVVDASGTMGRAYVNVISAEDIARAGQAIIVAGKRSADTLWPTTKRLANQIYQTLRHRGFSDNNIYYLSNETPQDANGDGSNDVDALATLANVEHAVSTWADNAVDLLVYLIDHGGEQGAGAAYVRVNETEVLLAGQLDGWLDTLQDEDGTDIVLAVDACQSGSFLDEVTPPWGQTRVTLASTNNEQAAFFTAEGLISFTDALLSGINSGLSVGASFQGAAGAMDRFQTAWMDDTSDGVYDKDVDGAVADGLVVGATFIAGADRPQIGKISANQTLTGSTSALIWASEIASVYPIERVWGTVVAPDFQPEETVEPGIPIESLPEFDLLWNGTNSRYEGTYSGFTQLGAYKVVLYARDVWDSVSVPKQTYINQTVSAEKVIIVAGEESYDANSLQSTINYVANYAYRTCLYRWIPKAKILYLNSNPSQDVDGNGLADDVDGLPTVANLQTGIGTWASDADQLTIYLIGAGSPDTFQIKAGEVVSATDLDGWLDGFQDSTGCKVVVVYDALQSGSFLDNLTPPAGQERITIAGCSASEASYCEAGGLISFSQYYFDWLFSGLNVRDSFQAARNAMRAISGYTQNALLDDDGDGDGDKWDGALALGTYLGAAFVTGDEPPQIGTVSDGLIVSGAETTATLWASNIFDPDGQGIKAVWVEILQPGFNPADDDVASATLIYSSTNMRYEATYADFTETGEYQLVFFARDNSGELSLPVHAVLYRDVSPDAYEVDDSPAEASLIVVNATPQQHNFHDAGDEDWVKFYVYNTPWPYTISTLNPGATCDTVISLFAESDLVNPVIPPIDDWAYGIEELASWISSGTGWFYVQIKSGNPADFGEGTDYELLITSDTGANNGLATAISNGVRVEWYDLPDVPGGVAGIQIHRGDGAQAQEFQRINGSSLAAISNGQYTDEDIEFWQYYSYMVYAETGSGLVLVAGPLPAGPTFDVDQWWEY